MRWGGRRYDQNGNGIIDTEKELMQLGPPWAFLCKDLTDITRGMWKFRTLDLPLYAKVDYSGRPIDDGHGEGVEQLRQLSIKAADPWAVVAEVPQL